MLTQILVTPDFDKNENLEYSRFEILQKENRNLEYSRFQKWSEHNSLGQPDIQVWNPPEVDDCASPPVLIMVKL